jgi:hypothetical protein
LLFRAVVPRRGTAPQPVKPAVGRARLAAQTHLGLDAFRITADERFPAEILLLRNRR